MKLTFFFVVGTHYQIGVLLFVAIPKTKFPFSTKSGVSGVAKQTKQQQQQQTSIN